MFWFFGQEACGILVPQPGLEPTAPALEGKVLTTRPPGKSLIKNPLSFHSLSGLLLLLWWLSGKESPGNEGTEGSIPGLGKSPGGRDGNPLPYSCLGNSMDRGAWWATVHAATRVRYDWATKPPKKFHPNTFIKKLVGNTIMISLIFVCLKYHIWIGMFRLYFYNQR